MSVKFTKHALDQMKARGISQDTIFKTLKEPDSTSSDNYGNAIAQKIIDKYLFRVFYYLEKETKIVITTYKTSKIRKYHV